MKKLILILSLFLLVGCSSREFKKSPVDEIVRDMSDVQDFTIVLFDMKEEGVFSKDYSHQYKIIAQKDGKPEAKTTDWMPVSRNFFFMHENDMGMEIVSKQDGKVTKQVAPPGYSNYVGNSQYGQWRTGSNGTSFWEFYGQYAFMSSMLGLVGGPIYRRSYYDYRDNYRTSRRPYYGGTTSSGQRRYGTYSQTALKQNPRSSFQQKVQSRVSRSGGSTSRSGSRYSSSSSSRSRSSSSRGGK